MTAEISKKAYSKSNMENTCKAMMFRVNAINVKYGSFEFFHKCRTINKMLNYFSSPQLTNHTMKKTPDIAAVIILINHVMTNSIIERMSLLDSSVRS